jgi:hypothetical protein
LCIDALQKQAELNSQNTGGNVDIELMFPYPYASINRIRFNGFAFKKASQVIKDHPQGMRGLYSKY